MPEPKLAVVLHIYYLDVAERALRQLFWSANRKFTLWITVSSERRPQVEALVDRYWPEAKIREFDNTGMDVLPFLRVLPELVEGGHTAVVKLHTKRGADAASAVWGGALLDEMCREPVLDAVDRSFRQHPGLDVIGLAPFYLSARKLSFGNESLVRALISEVPGMSEPPADWGFFAGTMFAARTENLLPLASWAIDNAHRFASEYQSDGLWEHALERVFCLMARQGTQSVGLVHVAPEHESVALQRVHASEGINQTYSRALSNQFESFEEDYNTLVQCDLLDTASYPLEGEVGGAVDLYRHYLLIGQFDYRASASKAWSLKRYNDWRIPWEWWRTQSREPDLVSVVIPVFNQPELTEQCVRALFVARTAVQLEVVCVDNGSEAATRGVLARLAREFPRLRLIRNDTNLNFALGCNIGFGHSRGARVVFLNNDTTVTDGWLDKLMARLDLGDCFAVQPQLRYPDGTLQCMGVVFSDKSTLGYPIYSKRSPSGCLAHKPRKFKALTAACLALNAADFAKMKGFDALFINGQEDVDLCLRLHQHTGKLGAYEPDSIVIHHESKTEGRGRWIVQNRKVFVHRWSGKVLADDYLYYEQDGFRVKGWKGDNEQDDIRVFRPLLEVDAERVSPLNASLKAGHESFLQGDYVKALSNFLLAPSAGGELKWLFEQCIALLKRTTAGNRAGKTAIVCERSELNVAIAALAGLPEDVFVLSLVQPEDTDVEAVQVCGVDKILEVCLNDRYPASDQLLPIVVEHRFSKVYLVGNNPLVNESGKLFEMLWGTEVHQI